MALSISRLINKKSVAFAAPVALALVVSACSEDDNAGNPTGMDGGGTGGAQGSTGGAKSSGGAKASGGSKSSGGASSGGAGGSGTGGGAGAGGAGTGGKGTGDSGTGGTGTGGTGTGGTGTGGTDGGAGTDGGDTGTPCTAQLPLTKPTVGSGIAVPSAATVVQHFHAEGTQNYKCTATTKGDGAVTYAWSAATPEANLYDGCHVKQGTHFAGPTWKSDADGSSVVGGNKVAEAHSGTIPWLRLSGVSHDGTGIFSQVTFIQRVNTSGGLTPSDPCGVQTDGASNVDLVVKVPYTADYYFFEGAADAGP